MRWLRKAILRSAGVIRSVGGKGVSLSEINRLADKAPGDDTKYARVPFSLMPT
jgi:hypothetical protein